MRNLLKRISHGSLEPVFYILYGLLIKVEYRYFKIKWYLLGYRKPNQQAINEVVNNVTIIYKSFERQSFAKRLYKCINSYYPGVKVIIADDSKKPLKLKGNNLKVLQLPFNSGLSYGLNRALQLVETPYTIRLDDDELLTPLTKIENELLFLKNHPEIDLVGFPVVSTPKCEKPEKSLQFYFNETSIANHIPLKIPHLTLIDKNHIVVARPPNCFIIRTDKLKQIGWDDNIRMQDHKEFFIRAAGKIVSTVNPNAIIFHTHNQFNKHYQKYRSDVQKDKEYIIKKYHG